MTMRKAAVLAFDEKNFHPLMTHSSPSRSARVVNIVRNVGLMGEARGHEGNHALIHYENVRVPKEALLGGEGQAFAIAQTRLGGGRIHHAMRTIGLSQKAST